MINFEKIQEDNNKNKIAEDRWKISENSTINLNLMTILEEKCGIEFIQYEDDLFVPMNLTYIGGDGFSSVYKINNNDSIVIKVTNEKSEIEFAKQLITQQKENKNLIYNNCFVKTQMLIPSSVSTTNHTEDYHKYDNVYIILEKLIPLTKEETNLLDDLENYNLAYIGYSIFSDFYDFDDSFFKSNLDNFAYANFDEDSKEFLFINEFGDFYRNVVDLLIENNWCDFNPKNIMKDNNNNLKIIDLQIGSL